MQNTQHRSHSPTRALAEWILRSSADVCPGTVSAAPAPDVTHPKQIAYWFVDREGLPYSFQDAGGTGKICQSLLQHNTVGFFCLDPNPHPALSL